MSAGPAHGASRWSEHVAREEARYRDGEARLPEIGDADQRQRQLTRMGNAAWGAGLALLMRGDDAAAAGWFDRAVDRYRESLAEAPPGSWGRYIGSLKSRLLAGDQDGARAEARRTLEAGARESPSPIGIYAAALALLALGDDGEAGTCAAALRDRDDFPGPVAAALGALAAADRDEYAVAVDAVLDSFACRDGYLEEVPVADTVLVLQVLARQRGLTVALSSPLLPPTG